MWRFTSTPPRWLPDDIRQPMGVSGSSHPVHIGPGPTLSEGALWSALLRVRSGAARPWASDAHGSPPKAKCAGPLNSDSDSTNRCLVWDTDWCAPSRFPVRTTRPTSRSAVSAESLRARFLPSARSQHDREKPPGADGSLQHERPARCDGGRASVVATARFGRPPRAYQLGKLRRDRHGFVGVQQFQSWVRRRCRSQRRGRLTCAYAESRSRAPQKS